MSTCCSVKGSAIIVFDSDAAQPMLCLQVNSNDCTGVLLAEATLYTVTYIKR